MLAYVKIYQFRNAPNQIPTDLLKIQILQNILHTKHNRFVVMLFIFLLSLNTNTAIYNVLKEVLESGEDVVPMDAVDQRVGHLFKFDFDLSGCHLSDSKVRTVIP